MAEPAPPTAEDWFNSYIRPTAPFVDYVSSPPRGMTNPPQNPKVRKQLLLDLAEQGVQLQAEVWPPPMPRNDSAGVGMLALRHKLRTQMRQKSTPAVFGGVSCVLPDPFAGDSKSSTSPKKKGKKPPPSEPTSPKWVYSAELDKHDKEYEVLIERSAGRSIGAVECAGELVAIPKRGTLFALWNRENPECLVKQGDRIVEVNGVRDNLHKMVRQFRKQELWEIKLRKTWNKDADAMSQSHGFPTARWRNPETFIFEGEPLGAGSPSMKKAASMAALGGSSGADKDGRAGSRSGSRGGKKDRDRGDNKAEMWSSAGQQKFIDRVMTEEELKNARMFLKGQSGLHSAATMDRFRFAADISRGAPLCIRGSGTATGTSSDVWASDGSLLVAFHNGAIRGVNPSGLEALPEPPAEKKKKKKGADDELDMGDSGVFQQKYPIDESLKSLRRLKRDWFPEACKREEDIAREKKQAEVADHAKAMLGAFGGLGQGLGFGAGAEAAAD